VSDKFLVDRRDDRVDASTAVATAVDVVVAKPTAAVTAPPPTVIFCGPRVSCS